MISLRELAAKALRRNQENQQIRDHLNLLCERNRNSTAAAPIFTDMEAARIRFLRRLYLDGRLSEF